MLRKLRFSILFLLIAGCIEPYEFVVDDLTPSLVIEAYISDNSFDETLLYPSDGRYFTVKLSETGDVTNTRPSPVKGAVVELRTSDGESFVYSEFEAGVYHLLANDFEARKGISYKLYVTDPDENSYESAWEKLPETDAPPMGDVGFTESEAEVYVMESSEWVLRKKQIVITNVEVPENDSSKPIYYRWSYSPMWIYVAPLISQSSPIYRCWATDPYYLNSFALQIDRAGGYKKDLFSLQTIRNERIFEQFSVLVLQQEMTESYYNFWKEMKEQNESSALTDTPPYNLKTNFVSITGGKKVSGYFAVTSEQAKRWYFNKSDLSYYMENTLRADCLVVYGPGPPAEECTDCRAYSFGRATTTRPSWWQQ
jgi:hypothetical protein